MGRKPYGVELILDLCDCSSLPIRREGIRKYMGRLCEIIGMEREDLYFWDYEEDASGYAEALPHLKGISAVQFIRTSNITIHSLEDLREIFINIFSCKDFDMEEATNFTKDYFSGVIRNKTEMIRG